MENKVQLCGNYSTVMQIIVIGVKFHQLMVWRVVLIVARPYNNFNHTHRTLDCAT